jgi:hypothetical protein
MDITEIDNELATYTPKESLATLAAHGLGGELLFPVPCILALNPRLLGYYRLLLGYSRKEFYRSEYGTSALAGMEDNGTLSPRGGELLPQLCQVLIARACDLVRGLGSQRITRELLDDLTLLTLGPQLRGGANVQRGAMAIVKVFQAIYNIVQQAAVDSGPNRINVLNAAGRNVSIEFAPDPDIIGHYR